MTMNTQDAKDIADNLLKNARTPQQKCDAINQTIMICAQHDFFIKSPIDGSPLRGCSISDDGLITYHAL